MKKLLLTSYAKNTLVLAIPLLPKKDTIHALFIPTAGDPYEDKDFVYVDREAMTTLGFSVTNIDLKKQNQKSLRAHLENTDLVLVAGGDVFYLFEHVKKSGFDKIIQEYIEKGLVYVGSSAGSIVCCPTLCGAREFDNPDLAPGLTEYTGMGLVDFVIIPHVQKEKYAERIKRATTELEVKGFRTIHLTDDQAVLIDGEAVKILQSKNITA